MSPAEMVDRLRAEVIRNERVSKMVDLDAALRVGVEDEHDVRLVMSALGWDESTGPWARVLGLEPLDDREGAERIAWEAVVRAVVRQALAKRPGGCAFGSLLSLLRVNTELDVALALGQLVNNDQVRWRVGLRRLDPEILFELVEGVT